MRKQYVLASLAFTLAGVGQGHAEQRDLVIQQDNSYVELSPYRAKEPKTLSDVPAPIRAAVEKHLIDRLGLDYYSTLAFSGGQVVDFKALYEINPAAANYRWKVFAYRLRFQLRRPDKGIVAYDSAVTLDEQGRVMEEIGFPPVRSQPSKASLVSLAEAYSIAERAGFATAKTRAELRYDQPREALAYRMTQEASRRDPYISYKVADIDAHTGAVIGIHESEAVR
jgi:hypothetical protein